MTEQVVAYQKKRVADHSVVDLLALDMPEQEFVTQALWYELPDELLREEFPLEVLQGSLHAAEHGQIAVLPLIAMCDRWDIGGLSTAFHRQTGARRSSSTTATRAAWASRASASSASRRSSTTRCG